MAFREPWVSSPGAFGAQSLGYKQTREPQGGLSVAKEANALVYVDRMGTTDAPAGWQSAIDAGADGIQTDRPAELVQYLREKGYKKP